jgi:Sec-independent protein translocase protein TatA
MARQRRQRGQTSGPAASTGGQEETTWAAALQRALEGLQKQSDSLQKSTVLLAGAFGYATGKLQGMAGAGFANTVQGEQLRVQFFFLHREIASLFIPVIEKATSLLRELVQRMRQLTGAEQETISRTLLAGVTFLGIVNIVPRVTAALRTLSASLTGFAAGNPLLALAAGLVAVLSLTDRGRQSLSSIGSNLLKAFQPVADFLADVILPALENLSEFLATAGGQVVAVTGLFLLAVPRIISGIVAIGGAFKSMTGALGLAATALGLLLALFGKSRFDKQVDDIAKAVRSGRKSIQEARDEVKRLAEEAAFEAEEQARGHRTLSEQGPAGLGRQLQGLFGGQTPEEIAEQVRRELEERGLARLERAGRGRRDVEPSRVGFEDPRETIKRLQAAALKVDPIPGKQLDTQRDILKQIGEILREIGKKGQEGATAGT